MKRTQPMSTRRYKLTPVNDGVEYINIYSSGQTVLGRMLSPFSDIGFVHPEYGRFASGEGFYYWRATGKQHDQLRLLSGFQAKAVGREFARVQDPTFRADIVLAARLKVEQNKELAMLLKENYLPFEHYYCFRSNVGFSIQDRTADYQDVIDELVLVSAELRT